MDMTSVLADCAFTTGLENGKSLVQRYSEMRPARPGTDESYLLNAYLQAKYRVLLMHSAVPGAGLHCHDVVIMRSCFLMDVAFSQSFG